MRLVTAGTILRRCGSFWKSKVKIPNPRRDHGATGDVVF